MVVVVAAGMAQAQEAAAPPATTTGLSREATFAFGSERWHDDSEVFWPGFLSGLRGFEHFYEPVGQPIYFESPFNYTGVRFLYLHHEFSDGSTLAGGDLDVAAVQARLALSERWQFIATKDGYSWLDADALPEDEGWNDIAAGLKYTFYADREQDLVMAGGARWQWGNGDGEVLQGKNQEVSPFISLAKGWDRFHVIADFTYRFPDGNGNEVAMWDVHLDYEVAPQALPGLAPVLEFHGVHYITDGDVISIDVGGLDYTNLGSDDVSGSAVVWAGAGARWKLNPHVSIGAVYEFALTDPDDDIMDKRVTVDLAVVW